MTKRFYPFSDDQLIKRAGLRILHVKTLTDARSTTVYRCKMSCCGDERDLTHTQVVGRMSKNSSKCSACPKDRDIKVKVRDGVARTRKRGDGKTSDLLRRKEREQAARIAAVYAIGGSVSVRRGYWLWRDSGSPGIAGRTRLATEDYLEVKRLPRRRAA